MRNSRVHAFHLTNPRLRAEIVARSPPFSDLCNVALIRAGCPVRRTALVAEQLSAWHLTDHGRRNVGCSQRRTGALTDRVAICLAGNPIRQRQCLKFDDWVAAGATAV